ncbi:hypothetical protein AVL55_11150 [Alteromonas macleodii]|uniref:Uncharacterized protein n=1 Tax=Alteromonas macleodii TaxID=28108 RepID=A0A126Q0G9_ALTMA|nr:hypothetical protein [Alteromonas macleodii]AMJ98675.1 hypothetical protein AVL55_11150 [Alteromonas macleodii]
MQGSHPLRIPEWTNWYTIVLSPRNRLLSRGPKIDSNISDIQEVGTLTEITIHLTESRCSSSTRQKFMFDFSTDVSSNKVWSVPLKIRDASYLWAWLMLDGTAARFPSDKLGLLKATSYASLLTGRILPAFNSALEAYHFFKAELPPASMRTLLGENEEELAIRIETGHLLGLGGYLGGLTESKDKTQFKAAISKLLPSELSSQLIPQPVLNERGKRVKNKFFFSAPMYTVK